jgi:RNA polymerase sigma factor (sigma-70 family)
MFTNNHITAQKAAEMPFQTEVNQLVVPIINAELLVKKLQLKTEEGFNMLFDHYAEVIYGILINLLQDSNAAKDLLQLIFLKIWRTIHDFDANKSTFFTWMLLVARTETLHYLKHSFTGKQIFDRENYFLTVSKQNFRKTNLTSTINHFEVSKAIELHTDCLALIDLVFFYGLTHQEALIKLERSLRTIEKYNQQIIGMKLVSSK